MAPDARSFIRHYWFFFSISAVALVMLICLATAVLGDERDVSPACAWPAGLENRPLYGVGLVPAPAGVTEIGRLLTVDAYYRTTGAVRERLTPGDVLGRARESGGFTYNPLYGATPQRGYAVSLDGYGVIFDGTITADDLCGYLRKNAVQVKDPARYVGGWADGGRFYLDVSIVLQDGAEARKVGRMNNQTGIFDLGAGETIYLKGQDGRWLVDAAGNWQIGELNTTAASDALPA